MSVLVPWLPQPFCRGEMLHGCFFHQDLFRTWTLKNLPALRRHG